MTGEVAVGELERLAQMPEVGSPRFAQHGEDAEPDALMDRVVQLQRRVAHAVEVPER